jgi:hypothetical protein
MATVAAVCAKSQLRISLCDLAPLLFGKKKGTFCVLGFYMDDSADEKRQVVFSVAGFLGESEQWFELERHWSRTLNREGIDYFRTYECVNLEGEFRRKLVDRYGLTTARVIADAMLVELKQIVAASPIYAYCLGVLMDDYRKVSTEAKGGMVLHSDPYYQAHLQLVGLVCEQMKKFPYREIVAFLYDEHSNAGGLQQVWGGFKDNNPGWGQYAGTVL